MCPDQLPALELADLDHQCGLKVRLWSNRPAPENSNFGIFANSAFSHLSFDSRQQV